jgi:hypothetical protein
MELTDTINQGGGGGGGTEGKGESESSKGTYPSHHNQTNNRKEKARGNEPTHFSMNRWLNNNGNTNLFKPPAHVSQLRSGFLR